MSIKSLLIANRGEIALRIIRTARAMGIRTIAVFSDADRNALHTRAADTAFHIGPAEAAQSYLNVKRIIETALKAGADTVHPGYGFLSENAGFAADCAAVDLRFVGPSAEVIRTMGSKIEAKKQAIAAGVPVVPGYNGNNQSDDNLCGQAMEIGFPVLIKASAGGGGRGMRVVEQPSDLPAALATARSEAEAGFGDPALLLERYVEKARHIEVQVMGDVHGNVVHLFERDCSLQRNHQKVIEEAPAPNLPEPLRQVILKSAVQLSAAVGYQSAGTVEYLLDETTSEFFFIEMNARLQVEYPVTEAVTGVDIVECQLRVAAGEPLPFRQEDITCTGWAIEARVAAEDPANGYCPETGNIATFTAPPACRTDSGVEAGSLVSHHYDSLLAKVIAYGHDRDSALLQLTTGLDAMKISGITTNLKFLGDLLCADQFVEGRHCTETILALYPDGWHSRAVTAKMRAIAVLARYLSDRPTGETPWHSLGAWRSAEIGGHRGMAIYHLDEQQAQLFETFDSITVHLMDEEPQSFTHVNANTHRLVFEQDGQRNSFDISHRGTEIQISTGTSSVSIHVKNGEEAFLGKTKDIGYGANEIRSPMPGLVAEILKESSTRVKVGDPVIVIEAMKLFQTLVAPCDGCLSAIHFRTGDTVDKHALLATFIPEEPPE